MPRAPATQQVLSDDEFDDLDELDSEDEDAGPSQSQKQKQNKGLLFGALKKPRPVTINTKQLHGSSSCSWTATRWGAEGRGGGAD